MIKVNLKSLLKEKGMTMTELHELTGITQNALSLMANGKSNGIQYNTLEKILKALNCSVSDLITVQSNPYNIYVNFIEVKNDIFLFSLVGVTNDEIKSEVIYGFEITKSKNKSRSHFHISYYGKDKTNLNSMNDELFIQSIFDFSNTTFSKDLLKVYAFLISEQILNHLNDKELTLLSLVTFSWYGLVHGANEEIIKVHLESRGNDLFPANNIESTATVNFDKLIPNPNIIEINKNETQTVVTMYLE